MSLPAVELREVFCVHRSNEGDAAALQGMTLALAADEVVCVLGPSGAGKSTLLRVIAGLQLPSAGAVKVLGTEVGRLGSRARALFRHRQLGFLGQRADAALSPSLSVREAVALPLSLRGAAARQSRRRVDELLDAAGLRERGGSPTGELSGGERQRLSVCAALAHRPRLLLADEPTGELDDRAAESVRGLISELARRDGAAALVVSHDPATAEIAGRTIGIRDGRVIEEWRNGEPALVIGPGGWLRLPAGLLADADIGERAQVRAAPGGLVVAPVAGEPRVHGEAAQPSVAGRATGTVVPAPAAVGRERWVPARVELRAVTRGYRQGDAEREVISGLSHAFVPGRMTVVTGRSGTGKTTLLRLIAGLDRPGGGGLAIDGRLLEALDAEQLAALRRHRTGYLPQEPAPVAFLSAAENVALALRMRGWDHDAARELAAAALARVGLADRASQRVRRLSAGEAQRVALARALASARGLLIVDEPTSRLDEAAAVEVAELLSAAAVEDAQTVICATHDPAVIRLAGETLALGVSTAA